MPLLTFAPLWDRLLSEGVVTITAPELAARAGATLNATYWAVHKAKARKKLFSPTKGLYVLVPPEYRSWGVVPADWFIDDMMRHLGRAYYLAFLTAAARHGASHQASQLFQVVCDGKVGDRDIGGIRLRFYTASGIAARAVQGLTGPTGSLSVATPETCVLDLADRPEAGAGINVILEVLGGLDLDVEKLVEAARLRSRAAVRRCGWFLSRTHPDLKIDRLRELASPDTGDHTLLVSSGERRGSHDHGWGVVVNTLVEQAA